MDKSGSNRYFPRPIEWNRTSDLFRGHDPSAHLAVILYLWCDMPHQLVDHECPNLLLSVLACMCVFHNTHKRWNTSTVLLTNLSPSLRYSQCTKVIAIRTLLLGATYKFECDFKHSCPITFVHRLYLEYTEALEVQITLGWMYGYSSLRNACMWFPKEAVCKSNIFNTLRVCRHGICIPAVKSRPFPNLKPIQTHVHNDSLA